MGYSKGTRWTDELIKEKVIEARVYISAISDFWSGIV